MRCKNTVDYPFVLLRSGPLVPPLLHPLRACHVVDVALREYWQINPTPCIRLCHGSLLFLSLPDLDSMFLSNHETTKKTYGSLE